MKVTIAHIGEVHPGQLFTVVDRERKKYTLKYESISGGNVVFKQMGRNTTKMIKLENDNLNIWLQNNYRKLEKLNDYDGGLIEN